MDKFTPRDIYDYITFKDQDEMIQNDTKLSLPLFCDHIIKTLELYSTLQKNGYVNLLECCHKNFYFCMDKTQKKRIKSLLDKSNLKSPTVQSPIIQDEAKVQKSDLVEITSSPTTSSLLSTEKEEFDEVEVEIPKNPSNGTMQIDIFDTVSNSTHAINVSEDMYLTMKLLISQFKD
jgi:hypothetical protein